MSNSQGFSPEQVSITLLSGVSQESPVVFMTFALKIHSKNIARLFHHHISGPKPKLISALSSIKIQIIASLYSAYVASKS